MSQLESDIFIEEMWDKYREQYLAECNAMGTQADLSDFWVWLDDHDLVPELDYDS